MFGNFFGIVIISASALLIAGLVLRTAPDLPATMNLGIVDNIIGVTQQSENAETKGDTSQTNTQAVTQTETQSGVSPDVSTAESNVIPQNISKEYLEIRQRAIETSATAPTKTNKSDAAKYKDK